MTLGGIIIGLEKNIGFSHRDKNRCNPGILEKLKKMDPNMISSHIGQLSQALGALQGVLVQFQKGDTQK